MKFWLVMILQDDTAIIWYFGVTEEQAAETIPIWLAATPAYADPPYHTLGPVPIWFTLNKSNMWSILNAAQSIMFPSGHGPDLFADQAFYTLQESPKKIWNSKNVAFIDLSDESAFNA